MDELTKLTSEHQEISSSIYRFLKSKIDGFEALDEFDNSNQTKQFSTSKFSCLINKALKLLIRLDGNNSDLSLPSEDLEIYYIDEGYFYEYDDKLLCYRDGHQLPLNFTKRQNRILRKYLNKRLSIINSDIKHRNDIRRKQSDIEYLEDYLKENKQLNRDRKINDLIPED